MDLSSDFTRILHDTETRVRHSAHAHWAATNRFDTLGRLTNLSTLIGGFLISSISAIPILYPNFYSQYVWVITPSLFFLGALVSLTSVLQVAQRWGERSQNHFYAANAFSSLRRELEVLHLGLPHTAPDLVPILERLQHLGETTPAVPENIWKSATKGLN